MNPSNTDTIHHLCAAIEPLVVHLRNVAADDREIAAALQAKATEIMVAKHPPRIVASHLFAGALAVINDGMPPRPVSDRASDMAACVFEAALCGLKLHGVPEHMAAAEALAWIVNEFERVNGGGATEVTLRQVLGVYERKPARAH